MKFVTLKIALALAALSGQALGTQILETSGFTTCFNSPDIVVQKLNIQFNNDNKTVTFDVAGTNAKAVNVSAVLNVTAYGTQVYSNSFNPCDSSTFIQQLCPLPTGTFAASGTQTIPEQYASLVPAIAFSIPDIAAQATLELRSMESGDDVACIDAQVTNGQTANVAAVSYVSAGVAMGAFVLTGATSLIGIVGAGGGVTTGGTGTTSPGFVQVLTWFQGMAMNGMMSVSYPPVYRAFTKNFAFSTGIIPWTSMQTSIDNFRGVTGGNLTQANIQYLQNATLVFTDGSTSTNTNLVVKRGVDVLARQISTNISSSTDTTSQNSSVSELEHRVSGIAAYIEDLSVPKENTFMTALLIIGIIIASIVVGILLFKCILEVWALFGSFPKSLTGFRKHYWGTMARSITQLILMLYGVVVLYSIFQFLQGDSWAAKALAGVVLGLFSAVIIFFTWKIWLMAEKSKEEKGDAGLLYDEKEIWLKYSLFYDSYKRDLWWTFIPTIVYALTKGCILAAADGHGLIQTIVLLVVEAVMLLFLIFARPYERKSGNVISILIQVVRAMSVVCILVFVEELGVAQTTQTVLGVVLIAVQSGMTAILAILIIVNAIIICCKENPHRKRRKEAEKLNRDIDNLTPLHAHNSLLMIKSSNSALDRGLPLLSDVKSPMFGEMESPRLPFLDRSRTQLSGTTSASSNYTDSNPYNVGLKPAPIGGSYTRANSYRNVLNADPPRTYIHSATRSIDEGRLRLVTNSAPMANNVEPERREMPGMLQMEGFAGYRGRL